MVNWEQVTLPISKGGLGIKTCRKMNMAFMQILDGGC